ncbi:MAG TPA: hypothetical protein VIL39_01220, partial [Verrucomicrobiae bacterium]
MIVGRTAKFLAVAALALWMLLGDAASSCAGAAVPKQRSLDEWRSLTAPPAPAPRVFVKGDHTRFYFPTATNVEEFDARWGRHRVPSDGYQVSSALLRWNQKLARIPEGQRGWREAKVVAGAEWSRLTTNLFEALTPTAPGHGAYYQGFLADRLLYRDAKGAPRFASIGEQPKEVIIDRHLSIDETLVTVAREVERDLVREHPGEALFMLLAPNARRFPQPLLLDRQRRLCVWLSPAALYDTTERGIGLSTTAQGLSALLLEGHGLALLKNPISSVARLADLGVESVVRFVRLPFPKPSTHYPPLVRCQGMDLAQWEAWLDRYTGTRQEEGSLDLLIDGEQFFPRLKQAIASAT